MMERNFLLLILFALFGAGCSAYDGPKEGMIWDFVNYNVDFIVVDKSGNDLLNAETSGNILENDIVVTYKENEYRIDKSRLKAIMPKPLALRIGYSDFYQATVLSFGEFSPESSYKGETFTINWGDGSEDKIMFDLYITWKRGDPTVHKHVFLNNQLCAYNSFLVNIVK